ncbi:MAG: hypothetical protein KF729_33340 [Sandaracinaceae bacterium]|nr:hypothetical protein [Sandaracinaceae bacterium]
MEWEPELRGEALRVEKHRPERALDAAVAAGVCCSCCCCCCCCAHAIGATVGTVAANVTTLAGLSDDREARTGALASIAAYWLGVAFVSLGAVTWAFVIDETLIALIVLVLVAPAVQLAGSFFALPAILLQPNAARRRAAAAAYWTSTVGWFVGGTIGAVIITGLLVAVGALIVAVTD